MSNIDIYVSSLSKVFANSRDRERMAMLESGSVGDFVVFYSATLFWDLSLLYISIGRKTASGTLPAISIHPAFQRQSFLFPHFFNPLNSRCNVSSLPQNPPTLHVLNNYSWNFCFYSIFVPPFPFIGTSGDLYLPSSTSCVV